MNGMREAATAALILKEFINPRQLSFTGGLCRGEEGQFFMDKMVELAALITTMPKTGEQSESDDPIAYLHYFLGNMDWYITEKDVGDVEEPGQHQAFGLANLGYGGELGYISIVELLENNIELDYHFTPKKLSEIKK
jgi:hypothetical protein